MVRISGTLTSNVTLSNRAGSGFPSREPEAVQAVKEAEKPVLKKDSRPDMTFGGIGRQIDIRV